MIVLEPSAFPCTYTRVSPNSEKDSNKTLPTKLEISPQ